MEAILNDRYYKIRTSKDAKYLMQSLHLLALEEVPNNAVDIYNHTIIKTNKFLALAKENGMEPEKFALLCNEQRRAILLERAGIFDMSHPQEWIVLHATHDGMTFKIYRCLESILEDLLEGKCDMYSDHRGRNRIIREDGVYVLYRMSEIGYAKYRVVRGEKKYSDPKMQHMYIVEYMFSSRDNLVNAGTGWYIDGGKETKTDNDN